MRKIIFTFMAAATAFGLQAKTVNVEKAGTLSSLLTDNEQNTLTELTITGPLNSADVKVLRAMTKTTADRYTGGLCGNGVLATLDLGGANFVHDNKDYYYDSEGMEGYNTEAGEIGAFMFYQSPTLQKFVAPVGTTSVGMYAFAGANNLRECIFSAPVKVIAANGFNGCTNLKPIDLSEIRSILSGAFSGGLKWEAVEIPDVCREFGGSAFSRCTNLRYITLGESINELESYFLNDLPALERIELKGDEIKQVCPNSFSSLPSLKSFVIHTATPPAIISYGTYSTPPFKDINSQAVLYVPAQSIEAYQNAECWKEFSQIKSIEEEDLAGVASPVIDSDDVKAIYTLSGQRLQRQPEKGIYIVVTPSGAHKVIK